MAAISATRRRHCREQKVRRRKKTIFSTQVNLFGIPEEGIRNAILNVLEENEDYLALNLQLGGVAPHLSNENLQPFAMHCGFCSLDFIFCIFTSIVSCPEDSNENNATFPRGQKNLQEVNQQF